MKKFLLTSAAMFVLGIGVSMAQSATTTTDADPAPATEKQCSKGGKKACCAAKAGASADASTDKKDCSSASAATEVKSTKIEAKSTTTALPVK